MIRRTYGNIDLLSVKGAGGDEPCNDATDKSRNSSRNAAPLGCLLPSDGQS